MKHGTLFFHKLSILNQFLTTGCDSSSVGRLRPSRAPRPLLLALGSGTAQGNGCLRRLDLEMNTYLVAGLEWMIGFLIMLSDPVLVGVA